MNFLSVGKLLHSVVTTVYYIHVESVTHKETKQNAKNTNFAFMTKFIRYFKDLYGTYGIACIACILCVFLPIEEQLKDDNFIYRGLQSSSKIEFLIASQTDKALAIDTQIGLCSQCSVTEGNDIPSSSQMQFCNH